MSSAAVAAGDGPRSANALSAGRPAPWRRAVEGRVLKTNTRRRIQYMGPATGAAEGALTAVPPPAAAPALSRRRLLQWGMSGAAALLVAESGCLADHPEPVAAASAALTNEGPIYQEMGQAWGRARGRSANLRNSPDARRTWPVPDVRERRHPLLGGLGGDAGVQRDLRRVALVELPSDSGRGEPLGLRGFSEAGLRGGSGARPAISSAA